MFWKSKARKAEDLMKLAEWCFGGTSYQVSQPLPELDTDVEVIFIPPAPPKEREPYRHTGYL